MPVRHKDIFTNDIATDGDFKVQLSSDNSGQYIDVVALDGSSSLGVSGAVDQGTGGSSAWAVSIVPTSSTNFAITPGSSTALEASHVLKSSAGTLYSLYVVTGATAGYLMTFNATAAPNDGSVTPVECIPVPANSIVSIGFGGAPPDYYATGIVAVFSSTGPFTKTASATAFFKWRVQ